MAKGSINLLVIVAYVGVDLFHRSDFSYNVGGPFQVVFRFVFIAKGHCVCSTF